MTSIDKSKNVMTRFSGIVFLLIGFIFFYSSMGLAQDTAAPYTVSKRYNLSSQLTGVISPDPDGSGSLKYAASRNTYNSRGLLVTVEAGELSTWQSSSVKPANWSGFTVFRRQSFTYDNWGRKLSEKTSSGTTTYAIKQYSYDILGRLECETVRMNPAAFVSLPSSACTIGTEGDDGKDRITRYIYNQRSLVTKVQKAYATPLQQDHTTYTYDLNNNRTSVKDANGNYAEMRYDGFDRMTHWYFPSKTTVGAINTADYEHYQYDANSNRKYVRKRDGKVIQYTFDNLDRIILKNIPGTANDVYYSYDLRGLQLYAQFASSTGQGIANVYDGFTQLTSSTTNMGGISRTLSNRYNANGKRTRLTFPDGQYFTFAYDGLDRQAYIKENGVTTLATFTYDNRGLPKTLVDQGGTISSLSYDSISRVKSLSNNFSGSVNDLTDSFVYNPASQITSRIVSNNAYIYQGDENITGIYNVNGLNQYTSAGGKSLTYDAKGNLISDGDTTFTFDVENRLLSASGATNATLKYDPLGRLYESTSGGQTTRFLYQGDALIAEYSTGGTMFKRYVHGNSNSEAPAVMYEGSTVSSSTRRFLHANYLGSVIAVSNSSGTVSNINKYDAYGIPQQTNTGRFGYTGQVYLPELGLYFYKARVYSPQLGRFLQVDPVGYEDQVNLYAYAGNDPLNNNDPSGKFLNFVAKFAVDVALNVALQAATGQPIDVGAALKESAMGVINPAKTLKTAAKLARALNKTKVKPKAPKAANSPCKLSCFVAGTKILTENGFAPIETIKKGDLVWAHDPDTGETSLKPVVRTFINENDTIWELRFVDTQGDIQLHEVTGTHPYYVKGKGWIEVINLEVGDRLQIEGGGDVVIDSLFDTGVVQPTYNFEVKDIHTYYVGAAKVLVHNCGGTVTKKSPNDIELSHPVKLSKTFSDPRNGAVGDLAEKLKANPSLADKIPPIEVAKIKGTTFSANNRRLRAFQEARVDVNTVPASKEQVRKIKQRLQNKKK